MLIGAVLVVFAAATVVPVFAIVVFASHSQTFFRSMQLLTSPKDERHLKGVQEVVLLFI